MSLARLEASMNFQRSFGQPSKVSSYTPRTFATMTVTGVSMNVSTFEVCIVHA